MRSATSAREQARIKVIKVARADADNRLPPCPEKYGAVHGSQFYDWYMDEYKARIATHNNSKV